MMDFTIIVHESMMDDENKEKYYNWTGKGEPKDSILIDSGFTIEDFSITKHLRKRLRSR